MTYRLWAILTEAILLVMTMRKLWHHVRDGWAKTTTPILRLLVLDGTWAFLVIFSKPVQLFHAFVVFIWKHPYLHVS
jgi:hypothetical protein